MTPDVLGYYKGTKDGRVFYVEFSTGPDIFGPGSMYGVTVRASDGSRLDPDPSRGGFRNDKGAALEYIAGLDKPANVL